MAIELYYSNQLNVLFECLNANLLASYRHYTDPFEADKIIVLNSHIRKWLQLKLAGKNGIVANIKFPFLEGILWDLLRSIDKSSVPSDLLNKEKFRVILYELFLVDLPPDLKILEKYINNSSTEKMKWARTWMLAEKISSLLMEYEYQRPDMIEAWMNGKFYLPEECREIEKAQRFLYLHYLHPKTGLLQKREKPLLTLFQYSKKVFSKPMQKIENAKPIHMFAISQVSVFHQHLLSKLKDQFQFHIYAFNPCGELWEDIKSPREDYQFQKVNREKSLKLTTEELDNMEVIVSPDENALLKNWGKTGREYIKLMSSLVDYNYFPGFIEAGVPLEKETVLQRVKRHILYRKNGAGEEKISQDKSIQIFNAPNINREVQTVFHSILQNLKMNSALKLHEIAILVPKLEDYHGSILSVFEGSSVPLKFGIAGNSAISDSLWVKGLLSLLDIAKGLLTRKDVFAYLTNPCAMSKFNYQEGQIIKWSNWVDKLNVFHHFDEKDKHAAGFPETLFFTWKQGLQRLRMGRLFASNSLSNQYGYPYFMPENLSSDDSEDLEKFILILEKVGEVVKDLKENKTPDQWVTALSDISKEFLKVPEDLEDEIKIIPKLLKNLDNIKDFETAAKEINSVAHLNLDMVYEVLVSALAVTDSVKGGFMNGGVVISELQPMRPFPFKITYILGLGGAAFPGRDVTFPLDLRIFKRKIGDISNSDRNRYLFLENFLSTSEKLYLSWVNKNMIKDEILEPSSVILQLKRYLETEVIKISDTKVGFKVPSVPLQSYHIPKHFSSNNEFTDLFNTYSLADHVHAQFMNQLVSKKDLVEKHPEIKKYFSTYQGSVPKEKTEKIKVKLKANDLKKYLEFPSYSYMGYGLNINETQYSDDEPLSKELEPLNLDFLQAYEIYKKTALKYFDSCRSENRVIDFLPFVEILIADMNIQFTKECALGEGAFRDYLLNEQGKTLIGNKSYYDTCANEIISSSNYYPGLFFGLKMDAALKDCKNLSLVLAPLLVEHESYTAEISLEVRNCWLVDKTLCMTIDKEMSSIQRNFYKDLIPLMLVFVFSDDKRVQANKLKIISFDGKIITSCVDKKKFKEYFLKLIKSFLFDNNQILLPGSLYAKLEDSIKAVDDKEFNIKFLNEINPKNGSFMPIKLPDYLSLEKFEISKDSKNIYLQRFSFMDFFQGEN